MRPRILIIGATSAIAHAVARRYAAAQAPRSVLRRPACRPRSRPTPPTCACAAPPRSACALSMLTTSTRHRGGARRRLGRLRRLRRRAGRARRAARPGRERALGRRDASASFDTNAALGDRAADAARRTASSAQGSGVIGVISSPAGDRGRASNYVYGAAKAAVSVFASGLRHRLHAKGVRVVTIVPGFVDTPMTAGFEGAPCGPSRRLSRGHRARARQGFERRLHALVLALDHGGDPPRAGGDLRSHQALEAACDASGGRRVTSPCPAAAACPRRWATADRPWRRQAASPACRRCRGFASSAGRSGPAARRPKRPFPSSAARACS